MSVPVVEIRDESAHDYDAIRRVIDSAFAQPAEARLVDALRNGCPELLALVAVVDQEIVGHICFSPVVLERVDGSSLHGMGLAPMAVSPSRQRVGVGSRLVRAGLERLQQASYPFVVVLGHPNYYPRFGFHPASRFDVRCEWHVPEDVFMMRWLEAAPPAAGGGGLAKYRREFAELV